MLKSIRGKKMQIPSLSLAISLLAAGSLAACTTTSAPRPDPALASENLRSDLQTAIADICFQSRGSSVADIAEAAGWTEDTNRIVEAYGPRSYLSDPRVWTSGSGVQVYNQVLQGSVCTINVFGTQASIAAEVAAELIRQRPEGYTQQNGPVLRAGEGYTPNREERTYLFDATRKPGPPIGLFVVENEQLGLSVAITITSAQIP
jgi:hypothetical protein